MTTYTWTDRPRIRWERGRHGIETGTVGQVRLFTLDRSTTRGSSDRVLVAAFPGEAQRVWRSPSREECEEVAETAVEEFMGKLGFVPENTPQGRPR